MPTSLTRAQHLAACATRSRRSRGTPGEAGLEADVPTCPDWTVRRLIGHQGMVHRWAAANLRGRDDRDRRHRAGRAAQRRARRLAAYGRHRPGRGDHRGAGGRAHDRLPQRRARAPLDFWARRQCHETTIHAVDALAAALGRYPRAADTWIDPEVARDGIDELLAGFMTRGKSRLRSADPMTIGVLADDGPTGWLVETSDRPAVVTLAPREEVADRADVRLEGPGRRGLPDAVEPVRRARRRRTRALVPWRGRAHHVGVTNRSRSGSRSLNRGTAARQSPVHAT